jgi:putative hydrolase of the HAD superfamily
MHVHRQLRPKPSTLMLRRLLRRHGLSARRCILVEDTLVNLKHAKRLGLRTAWVTRYLPRTAKRPAYVDVKVKSVLQLPRKLHRLR